MVKRKLLTNVKRTLALTLTSTVLATLLPGKIGGAEVQAASNYDKYHPNNWPMISMKTGLIEGADSYGHYQHYLYFGNDEGKATKYRVLTMDARDGDFITQEDSILLDCDMILDGSEFSFGSPSPYSNSYADSKLRSYINDSRFLNSKYSQVEQKAMSLTTVGPKAFPYNNSYDTGFTNDRVFVLSAENLENEYIGYKTGDDPDCTKSLARWLFYSESLR